MTNAAPPAATDEDLRRRIRATRRARTPGRDDHQRGIDGSCLDVLLERPRGAGRPVAARLARLRAAVRATPSPVGRVPRRRPGWSDLTGGIEAAFNQDEILTWVTAYWLTNTIGTSFAPTLGAWPGRDEA